MAIGAYFLMFSILLGFIILVSISQKKRYVLVHLVKYPGKESRISTMHFSLHSDSITYKENLEFEIGIHSKENRYIDRIQIISTNETIVVVDSVLHHIKIEKIK